MRRIGKRSAAVVVALAVASGVSARVADEVNDASSLHDQVLTRLERGDYVAAAPLLEQYLKRRPSDGVMLYNAACVRAQLGEVERAERRLLDAVKAGFRGFSHMQRDHDLDPLRDRPMLQAIISARAVAEPLLMQRRIDRWRTRLGEQNYRLTDESTGALTFLTPLPDDQLDPIVRRAEGLMTHLTAQFFGRAIDHRVLVLVLAATDATHILTAANMYGVYQHEERQLITRDVGASLRHELVHALHEAHMDRLARQHPIWIREGLASLYEAYAPADDGGIEFLANDRDRIARRLLAENRLPAWAALLRMTDQQFDANRAAHYAVVRTIFEFLAERGVLIEWYQLYTDGSATDTSGAAALQTVFRADLDQIETRWRQWLRQRQPSYVAPNGGIVIVHRRPRANENDPEVTRDRTAHAVLRSELNGEARQAADDIYQRCRPRLLAEYEPAIGQLRAVVATDRLHAAARYDLGLAYILTGNHDAALRERDALRGLDGNLANLLAALVDD